MHNTYYAACVVVLHVIGLTFIAMKCKLTGISVVLIYMLALGKGDVMILCSALDVGSWYPYPRMQLHAL